MNEFNFFDSLFNDLMGANTNKPAYTCSYATPKVDIREEKNCYILDMELPGKTENDVNIELDHDVISISSKKEESCKDAKTEKEEIKYLLRERNGSNFVRRFSLPDDADREGISASFKNGILTVSIQKKEHAAPRKIEVKAA